MDGAIPPDYFPICFYGEHRDTFHFTAIVIRPIISINFVIVVTSIVIIYILLAKLLFLYRNVTARSSTSLFFYLKSVVRTLV